VVHLVTVMRERVTTEKVVTMDPTSTPLVHLVTVMRERVTIEKVVTMDPTSTPVVHLVTVMCSRRTQTHALCFVITPLK